MSISATPATAASFALRSSTPLFPSFFDGLPAELFSVVSSLFCKLRKQTTSEMKFFLSKIQFLYPLVTLIVHDPFLSMSSITLHGSFVALLSLSLVYPLSRDSYHNSLPYHTSHPPWLFLSLALLRTC